MRRTKKTYRIRFFLLAILAFLLTIWLVGPIGAFDSPKGQEENTISQQDREESNSDESKTEEKQVEEETTTDAEEQQEEMSLDEKVTSIMDSMTLEEKIGQLMVVGFQSHQVDEHIKKMIEDYHVGGVILYDRNMETPKQVAQLTNDLQGLAQNASNDQIPLTISIDQEGGSIVRMRDRVSPIPSQQELGKRGDEQEIYTTAKRTGRELAAMGINVNYAPDVDLSSIDTRSFGSDPDHAYQFGKQVVNGLADSGIAATLKHFPGNGRSTIDPHIETSSVEANKWDLENNDIYPFKKMIENVDHNQFFVMVTHIKYPAYDQEKPASISPVIIQDLLREQLGYTGLVVTDDLEMGAVSKYFTYQDLGFEAVQAGADVLLVCHTFQNQDQVYKGVLNAVQAGKLAETRIDEAVERILRYKLISIQSTYVDPNHAEQVVGQ
ncbi:glycosyl hydrolase family 3 [Bacillus sp. V3B]|uniref:glycoside hydrolase family 3 protein n=1 Tax=Bacillus sp. V3B TaxID=2804915 RepID=UPI002109ADDE|nr:glycoside hydrolase family 3 N-terminal domain-containing protein [Bacillus sp. V3B]MCQ6277096.1 glycosyl hydrolase family 3 [Bacillus sp. V3B]